MLDSTIQIIKQYTLDSVSRASITYFEITRLDIEDFFYLIRTKDSWYLVYESDFINNLPGVADSAKEIYGSDFTLLHWIPTLASKSENISLYQKNDHEDGYLSSWYKKLRYDSPDNHLRYALIELKPKFESKPQTVPDSYGS